MEPLLLLPLPLPLALALASASLYIMDGEMDEARDTDGMLDDDATLDGAADDDGADQLRAKAEWDSTKDEGVEAPLLAAPTLTVLLESINSGTGEWRTA